MINEYGRWETNEFLKDVNEFLGDIEPQQRIWRTSTDKVNYSLLSGIAKAFRYKKIIFNDPATIILWEDGTKTVVKCGENDTYDPEKGIALCFMKKALGNKSGPFNKILHKETDGLANAAVEKISEVGLINPIFPEEIEAACNLGEVKSE